MVAQHVVVIPAWILQALSNGSLERFAKDGVEIVADKGQNWSAYWLQLQEGDQDDC